MSNALSGRIYVKRERECELDYNETTSQQLAKYV